MELSNAQQAGTVTLNGWVVGSIFICAVVIAYAIIRQRNMPQPVGNDDLRWRVAELERLDREKTAKIEEQNLVINSLQRLLVEKDQDKLALTTKINEMEVKIRQLEAVVPHNTITPKASDFILACIGDDDMFRVDMAAFRSVKAKTGLRFSRVFPVTMAKLKQRLDGYRVNGTPIRYVHFAVHGNEEGLVFADGLATGVWLSHQLAGAEIVVIAACESETVGGLLGVVQSVITMAEDIHNTDAGKFTEVFWTGVGEGLGAEDAFNRALDRCPPEVAEFVVLH